MPLADSNAPSTSPKDATGGLIQSPALSDGGKPAQKSVKDVGQARDIIKTLTSANRTRQVVNSRIMAKYNAERPYVQAQLETEGLGWRSNFTTKPLPLMIDKVAPRFVESISGLKYVTNAQLPASYQGSTVKTEAFRCGITKLVRARKGWRTLIEDIAQENALFGHTAVSWLDEFTWFPRHFKQDEIFLTDGTKQLVSTAQVVLLSETYLPHELYAQIKDSETAKTVGWNIPNVIAAINTASPANLRDSLNTGGSLDSWYQNAERELNLGSSYMGGASVVKVYSLLVQEVEGKVSHYRFAGAELNEIFSKDDRFASMDDCMSFFAFQKGNGTMHGSKGIGREIYELAGMIDRTRNEVVDRSILSGKTLIQGDLKQLSKFKMSVVGASCIVPNGWVVLDQKIDGNIEPFLKLDAYFSMLVDQLIGSVSPRVLEGERVTAAQVDLYAAREEEGKDTRISRFLEQFTDMMSTMQRRICDRDTVEKDAKLFQEQMLEIMTPEEFELLAKEPVAGTVIDLTPMQRQLVVQIATEKRGNPLYNQRQLEVEDLTARVDSDFVERVLLPENDPTDTAEQTRMQLLELSTMVGKTAVPVSPRDNHQVHLQALIPTAEQVGTAMLQGGSDTELFAILVQHAQEHYDFAIQSGIPPDQLKPVKDFLTKATAGIEKLKALDAAAQQVGQASQMHDQAEAVAAPLDQVAAAHLSS